MQTHHAACLALTLAACTPGMVSAPPVTADTPSSDSITEREAPTAGAERCTVVQRGAAGGVHDARIAEHWPSKNYGAVSTTFAGTVAGGARHTLLVFELPAVPEGAVITSAEIRLHKCVCGGSGVEAYRVTAPWHEDAVTWDNFGHAYESRAFASIPATDPERAALDVTPLARGWADGSLENHGVLLAQADANTAFSTSEAADPAERPLLELCWTTD